MKLYHVSPIENEESITEQGIYPNSTDMGTCVTGDGDTLQGQGLTGVYGFTDVQQAIWFAEDNRGMECNCIFEFETGDCDTMDDPEYDGEAMFVVTDEPIMAVKIEIA